MRIPLVKRGARAQGLRVSDKNQARTREERLAAKLRENLRRRKAQARALGGDPGAAVADLPKPHAGR